MTSKLLRAVVTGQISEASLAFESIMRQKMQQAINVRKQIVAKSLFSERKHVVRQ